MTSQGPVAPPPLPLLVKDKEYAVDTAHSIVQDADLDDCSKLKTDSLGESGPFDMMRACSISIAFFPFLLLLSLLESSISLVPFD